MKPLLADSVIVLYFRLAKSGFRLRRHFNLREDFRQPWMSEFLHLVSDPQAGFVELDDALQINRASDQNQVAGNPVDGLFQFMPLHHAVTHRGVQMFEVREAVASTAT